MANSQEESFDESKPRCLATADAASLARRELVKSHLERAYMLIDKAAFKGLGDVEIALQDMTPELRNNLVDALSKDAYSVTVLSNKEILVSWDPQRSREGLLAEKVKVHMRLRGAVLALFAMVVACGICYFLIWGFCGLVIWGLSNQWPPAYHFSWLYLFMPFVFSVWGCSIWGAAKQAQIQLMANRKLILDVSLVTETKEE